MTSWHLAHGYQYAAVNCGIRPDPNRLDLAMVVSERPAAAAGVFTQNRVVAAPVRVCRERLPRNDARGFVVCSGNANACTGPQGMDDARRMTAVAAESLGCKPEQVLVCSTGVIGRHLPMTGVEAGIRALPGKLAPDAAALDRVAHAILTTDTRIKVSSRAIELASGEYRVTGFCKGAAMIGPNMATMLAFVLSDAPVSSADLAAVAPRAADKSFNCISVEGHTSTNDSVLFFANGAGAKLSGGDLDAFNHAVTSVCSDLAKAIAADAEGATKTVHIAVEGLRDDAEARRVAKAIADSALVKTAIFGADPNWGRIVSAAGYTGVHFDEEHLSLWLGDTLLYENGVPLPFDAKAASAYLKDNRDIHMRLRFTLGSGQCTFWTCDLTHEYITLNADYTT